MLSQDSEFVISFNGEIYNYVELRNELVGLGVIFKGNSDTEVLLASYRQWGRDCVLRLRGPFAFAIWDEKAQIAFLGRDRCGEKPLFYALTETHLSFASELKGLLPIIDERPGLNPSAVDMYLHYQYAPEPFTLLEGIHKLAAGHTLELSIQDWTYQIRRYWSVEQEGQAVPGRLSQAAILSQIRTGLEDAVKMTLRADVPVGIALSGGVDSGAIAVLAQQNYPQPMHAFCVGYPGRPPYDERIQAKELAQSLGMIIHEVELPVDSFVEFFPQLVQIMDEPIADPAAFGHYAVPRAAADQGIKVLLSGVGGDEIFWGYPYVTEAVRLNQLEKNHPNLAKTAAWFKSSAAQQFLQKVAHYPHAHPFIRRCADALQKLGDPRHPSEQLHYYQLHPEFFGAFDFKDRIYGPAMDPLPDSNIFRPTDIGPRSYEQIPAAIIRMLFDTWLTSNCLSLGDRVSMAVGVETRMPFLDFPLIDLVMALRLQYPDHALGQKAWLRSALKGVLPDAVLARPKAGFQPPVQEWLSGVVTKYSCALKGGHLEKSGILNPTQIEFICHQLPTRGHSGLFMAYKLVLLELWYQKVVSR
jgi:asparagine synthase (glutamine-hydrolysing)